MPVCGSTREACDGDGHSQFVSRARAAAPGTRTVTQLTDSRMHTSAAAAATRYISVEMMSSLLQLHCSRFAGCILDVLLSPEPAKTVRSPDESLPPQLSRRRPTSDDPDAGAAAFEAFADLDFCSPLCVSRWSCTCLCVLLHGAVTPLDAL